MVESCAAETIRVVCKLVRDRGRKGTGGKSLVDRSKVFRGRGACNLLRFDVLIAQMKAETLKFTSLIQLFTPIQILSEMWIDEVR